MALHQHHHHHARQADSLVGSINSLFSVVFVTASPTFSGPAGGFITLTPTDFPQQATAPADQPLVTTLPAPLTTQLPVVSTTPIVQQTQPATTQVVPTSIVQPSVHSVTQPIVSTPTPTSNTAVAAQTSAASAPVSSGSSTISGGAIAGIVIALLLLLVLGGIIAAYFYRRKRQTALDEKNPFGDNAAAPAPLRSITPPPANRAEWMNSQQAVAPKIENIAMGSSFDAGNMTRTQVQDPEKANPFGNHAALDPTDSGIPAPLRINVPPAEAGPIAVGAIAGAAAATATAVRGSKIPQAREDKVPGPFIGATAAAIPSPTKTDASVSSAVTVSNVHRIQLDFKPSMDDELELRAGQLVRLLHEYDDGWALCTRLDRSQQGVAPRTCLSTRPVKPRQVPGTPPPLRLPIQGTQSRGAFPPALAPGGDRAMSPTPFRAQPRSMSPGPYGGGPQQQASEALAEKRTRSNSDPNIKELRSKVVALSPMNPNALNTAEKSESTESTPASNPENTTLSTSPPHTPITVSRKPVPGQGS